MHEKQANLFTKLSCFSFRLNRANEHLKKHKKILETYEKKSSNFDCCNKH